MAGDLMVVQPTMGRKSSQQELEVAGCISFTVWKKRTINAPVLSSFSRFHTVVDPSLGTCITYSEWACPQARLPRESLSDQGAA